MSFMPRSPRVCSCHWSGGGGCIAIALHVIRGSHSCVYDVEAFPHGVVAIELGVEV